MKVYRTVLIYLSLCLVFSSIAADTTEQEPTFQIPLDDENDVAEEAANNRYIIKFKPGSKEYEKRIEEAHRRHSMRKILGELRFLILMKMKMKMNFSLLAASSPRIMPKYST